MSAEAACSPVAIEIPLSWGPVVRGLHWGCSADVALLLHEPGADLDAWGALPQRLATTLAIEVIAVDLPGHGLSDDPWEPDQLPALIHELPGDSTAGLHFIVAAGATALAVLRLAPDRGLAGLVCLSPDAPGFEPQPKRSPRVPKRLFAGSLAGNDLTTARRLASCSGGWAVVTSLPVAARGTGLLASVWRGRIGDETIAFLRECHARHRRGVRLSHEPTSRSHSSR